MLLAQAERRLSSADRLAKVIPNGHDADRMSACRPTRASARHGHERLLRVDPSGSIVAPRMAGTGRKPGVQGRRDEPPGRVGCGPSDLAALARSPV